MPARKTSAEAWVGAALRALADGGADAIRVEALAATLGVTKGGFYGEFADRNALIERMLDTWEQTVVDAVMVRIDGAHDSPRDKLRHLFTLARDLSSNDFAVAVELGVRDWARRDRNIAQRLARVDNRRMSYMRGLFRQISRNDDDAEARCLLANSLFIGNALISVDHDGRSRTQVIDCAVAKLLDSK